MSADERYREGYAAGSDDARHNRPIGVDVPAHGLDYAAGYLAGYRDQSSSVPPYYATPRMLTWQDIETDRILSYLYDYAVNVVTPRHFLTDPGGFLAVALDADDADALDDADAAGLIEYVRRDHELQSRGTLPTVTARQLRKFLMGLPADTQITIGTPDGSGWLNIVHVTDPRQTGDSSVILETADDFDTRQF